MHEERPSKFINLIQWLILLGIFGTSFFESVILLTTVFLLLCAHKLKFDKNIWLVIIIGYIFFSSTTTILIYNYPIYKFLQQFVLISCFMICYWAVLSSIKNYINSFFEKYLKIAIFMAFLGIVQYIVFYFTSVNIFSFAQEFSWDSYKQFRITSLAFCEPARFAALLTPALFYYLINYKLTQKIIGKIILLIAYLLTSSFTANVVLLIKFCVLFFYKIKRFIKILPIMVAFVLLMFAFNTIREDNQYSESKTKLILNALQDFSIYNIDKLRITNLSLYATTKNLWVAVNSPSRLFGTGLGTHEFSHDNLIVSTHPVDELNKQDAYSLGVRIFSELGFVGLCLLICFLFRFSNFKNLVNFSVFFLLLSLLLRGGHYVSNGTILFFYLYYFTGKMKKEQRMCIK